MSRRRRTTVKVPIEGIGELKVAEKEKEVDPERRAQLIVQEKLTEFWRKVFHPHIMDAFKYWQAVIISEKDPWKRYGACEAFAALWEFYDWFDAVVEDAKAKNPDLKFRLYCP